ncbi:hypothetical protein FRB91_006775 [Serendipita sp. 411]|nr:hypothetical protein FRB91_006775 [Serendipita sp. 411]
MKVIVFGASGYIGTPVSNALVRNGHIVYGVSRSKDNAPKMRANEIIPLVGDADSTDEWKDHLKDADVVIDCAAGMETSGPANLKAVETLTATVRKPGTPKLAYIYTSGIWVHGSDRTQFTFESGSTETVPTAVAWRPQLEQDVVNSQILRGIVIRSGTCYGRAGSLIGLLFSQGDNKSISWFGTAGGSYTLIHVDDLAECFLLAAEKNHLVGGLILDATNEVTESVDGILHAFSNLVGIPWSKVSYRPCANILEEAMSGTIRARPTLARTLLGWHPRRAGLIDGMSIYYEAYKNTP